VITIRSYIRLSAFEVTAVMARVLSVIVYRLADPQTDSS